MPAKTSMSQLEKGLERLFSLFSTAVTLILHRKRSKEEVKALMDALQAFKDGTSIAHGASLSTRFVLDNLSNAQRQFCLSFISSVRAMRPIRCKLHQSDIYTFGELLQWTKRSLVDTFDLPPNKLAIIENLFTSHEFTMGVTVPLGPDAANLGLCRMREQLRILGQSTFDQLGFKRIPHAVYENMGILTIGHFVRRVNNERDNVISFCNTVGGENSTLAAEEIIEFLTFYGFLEGMAYFPRGVTLPAENE